MSMVRRLREAWDRRGGGPECRRIVEVSRREIKRLRAADRAAGRLQ